MKLLRDDLELRRKQEIHEIEERKNTHINELMKKHERAFAEIKNYYNDITHNNLDLIKVRCWGACVRGGLLKRVSKQRRVGDALWLHACDGHDLRNNAGLVEARACVCVCVGMRGEAVRQAVESVCLQCQGVLQSCFSLATWSLMSSHPADAQGGRSGDEEARGAERKAHV